MARPDDFAAILAARTPGRWHWHAYGHRSIRAAAGMVTRALFKGVTTDLYWVHEGTEDDTGPNVALMGNGPKSYDNAVATVAAVNLAPLLLDLWRAADDVAGRSPTDVDGEGLGGEWCHFCDAQTPNHRKDCDWKALGAALAALEAAS